MRMKVMRKDVKPGDVLINFVGQPFFRVDAVDQARARGYIVFSGDYLVFVDGARTAGGYGKDVIEVEREAQ